MKKRFICLANSYKEGGRCMAGIELDDHLKPVIEFGKPKWIRPVCDTEHGQIPDKLAEPFKLLDIVEMEVLEEVPEDHQTENVTFDEKTIRTIGIFEKEKLEVLCENKKFIFENAGKAVSQNFIENLEYSLMLISCNTFEVIRKSYDDRHGRPQRRLEFKYNGNVYDFPITDPVFLYRHKNNSEVLKSNNQIIFCVSLGIEWENWYYKLVAGIIF